MMRASSTVTRRLMSSPTAGPRWHKASEWEAMKASRPHDDHPHVRTRSNLRIKCMQLFECRPPPLGAAALVFQSNTK